MKSAEFGHGSLSLNVVATQVSRPDRSIGNSVASGQVGQESFLEGRQARQWFDAEKVAPEEIDPIVQALNFIAIVDEADCQLRNGLCAVLVHGADAGALQPHGLADGAQVSHELGLVGVANVCEHDALCTLGDLDLSDPEVIPERLTGRGSNVL